MLNSVPNNLGSGQSPGRATLIVDSPLGRLLLTAENGAVRALDWWCSRSGCGHGSVTTSAGLNFAPDATHSAPRKHPSRQP
ncbi:hypothetical protein WCLP8_4150004 [uncultured Gammaproteobacteria bacterium]